MTTETPKFVSTASHAEAAQFHMGFAVQMLNCGRDKEANEAFQKAHQQLQMIRDNEEIKTEVFG